MPQFDILIFYDDAVFFIIALIPAYFIWHFIIFLDFIAFTKVTLKYSRFIEQTKDILRNNDN